MNLPVCARLTLLLGLSLVSTPFSGAADNPRQSLPQLTGLVQLMARPANYEGKLVSVIGVFQFEFEGQVLYLSREDYDNSVEENGLWLELNDQVLPQAKELSGKYVNVVGVFHSDSIDAFNRMRIGHIQSISLWSDPAHPRRERNLERHRLRPETQ